MASLFTRDGEAPPQEIHNHLGSDQLLISDTVSPQ